MPSYDFRDLQIKFRRGAYALLAWETTSTGIRQQIVLSEHRSLDAARSEFYRLSEKTAPLFV